MKRSIRLFAAFLLILMLCATFAACSKGYDANERAPSYNNSADGGNGFEVLDSTVKPEDAERKIIKTFEISAETTDFDAATAALNALITEHGAYVESSSSYDQSLKSQNAYARRANYTVRVPAEHAEAFVSALGGNFNVTSSSSRVEDISDTYYSIEARLEELQIERDSLLDILAAPETEKDYDLWLTVQQRLSEVKQQIAVYQGQINRYDGLVAYSTVHLSISEVINYTVKSENNGFFARLWAATKEGWTDFFAGLLNFVIWLAGALPTLILLTAIGVGIWLFIRALVRRKRKKKAARLAKEQAEESRNA